MKKLTEFFRTILMKVCSAKKLRDPSVVFIIMLLALINVSGVKAFPYTSATVSDDDPATIMQQQRITGTITDSKTGETMPGVNVLIEGTTVGTTTDANGKYSIDKPAGNVVLVISFIGYNTQKISADGSTAVDVKLEAQLTSLDEVVVTGYSVQRKKDITGSVAVVDVSTLQASPSVSVQQALQGMASGVDVTKSGVPGAQSKIYIRGISSFGNTDPLVIVDGIQQDINNISTNDIESIQVLKDAGAATIYGVRGSNGVILVTTKKGKSGKPVISYEGSVGTQFPLPGDPWNVLNSQDYMDVYLKAFPGNPRFINGMPDFMFRGPAGAGVAMAGDPLVDPSRYKYASPNRGTNYIIQEINKEGEDWWHHLYKRAPIMDHNITASGGTDKSKYLFSLGYLNQSGTLVHSSLKRYSARINTEYTLGKHLRVGENFNIIHRENYGLSENSQFGGIVETLKMQPIIPLYDIGGNFGGTFGGPELGDAQNPVAVMARNKKNNVPLEWYMIGNAYAELDFLKDFTARTSIGFNILNSYNHTFTETQVENVQANTSENSLSQNSGYGSTMTFTNTLTYKKTLDKHNIVALFGSEAIEYVSRYHTGSANKFFSMDPTYLILNNGTQAINATSSINKEAMFSLFGKLDYNFNDKYYFGATVRRDGSSRFGADSRYGVFPAFSAGWRITGESFMSNVSWLNDLKLRGSYGVLGSQNNVSPSNAFTLYGSSVTGSYYDITGTGTSEVQGFFVSRIGNTATQWERDIISNIGIDALLLNNKLDISLEWYNKYIDGLLFTQPLPAVVISGATAPTVNVGDISNKGIDATVGYRGNIGEVNFYVKLNVGHYKNTCENIPDPGYFDVGGFQGVGAPVRNQEGHPISSYFGYKVVGLFQSAEDVTSSPTQTAAGPGRFKYADTNGDNAITSADRTFLGDPNPDFTSGLNINMDYKNFDFSAFFYASVGNEICNLNRSYLYFFSFYPTSNKSNDLLNAWTPTNTDTDIPILETASNFSNSATMNSFYIEDGSFLKLKSLQLGYTFNSSLMQSINISKLRLYIQTANLFTLTKYTGLDPEFIGGGAQMHSVDLGSYPNNELNLIFGVSLTF